MKKLLAIVLAAACARTVKPPVATISAPATAAVGDLVTFDGSQSSDPQGMPLQYRWSIVSAPPGSTAQLSGAAQAKPTLLADLSGAYTAELVVSDGPLTSQPAKATVAVSRCDGSDPIGAGAFIAPFRFAAGATALRAVVLQGETVQLTATNAIPASPQCAGAQSRITYQWAFTQLPFGSTALLNSRDLSNPSFTADVSGQYVLTLTERLGGVSSQATVTVTAEAKPDAASVNGPYSAVAIDPTTGQPVLGFFDVAAGNVELLKCTSPTCAEWIDRVVDDTLAPLTFSGVSSAPRPLDVKVDASGNVFIAYYHPARCAPVVAVYDPRLRIKVSATVEVVGPGCAADGTKFPEYGRWLSLAVDGAGVARVAYSAVRKVGVAGQGSNVRVATCAGACSSTASWTAVDASPLSDGVYAAWPSLVANRLAAGTSARLAFATGFTTTRLAGVGAAQYAELGGLWTIPQNIEPARSTDLGRFLSMDATPAGGARIAYQDEASRSLRFAACDSGCTGLSAWTATPIAGSDDGRYLSLAIDAAGTGYLSFQDGLAGVLKLGVTTAPGGSAFAVASADRTGVAGLHTAIAALGSPATTQHLAVSYADSGAAIRFFGF